MAREYEILCPSCGGKGCDDCDRLGTVVMEGENPRADGLPWHPHAKEGPKDIQVPPSSQTVRRRRSVGQPISAEALASREAELLARERALAERERSAADTAVIPVGED